MKGTPLPEEIQALRLSTRRRDTTQALQTNLRKRREEEMSFGSIRLDLYRVSVHKTVCLAYPFIDKQNFATYLIRYLLQIYGIYDIVSEL